MFNWFCIAADNIEQNLSSDDDSSASVYESANYVRCILFIVSMFKKLSNSGEKIINSLKGQCIAVVYAHYMTFLSTISVLNHVETQFCTSSWVAVNTIISLLGWVVEITETIDDTIHRYLIFNSVFNNSLELTNAYYQGDLRIALISFKLNAFLLTIFFSSGICV